MIILIAAGVLLFVFAKSLVYEGKGLLLNGIVGSVIALYGVEDILYPIITNQAKKERIRIMSGVINLFLAGIMIFLLENHPDELHVTCILWSVWSIMRESEEIFDKCFDHWKQHPVTSFINLAESIVVIVFSLLLIIAKDEEELLEHTFAHVILLGVELIIEVIWEYVGDFENKAIERAKRRARYLKEKAEAQRAARKAKNESKRNSN
jgi:hypothetical protein